ncbi:hypothetical protein BJ742DRAFT_154025 [Cladochytrium replicatum]|nr:hypothetical protein BJ742DRAFT_154025 [Cladochytrium replicatum]
MLCVKTNPRNSYFCVAVWWLDCCFHNMGAEPITHIGIDLTDVRTKPDQHVAYRIAIKSSVRGWNVWKRYSEFDTLNNTLANAFPLAGPPPATLPPKTFSLLINPFGLTPEDPKKIQERRKGLERYLLDILHAPDNRWRTHPAWYDFLAVPDTMRIAAGAQQKVAVNSGTFGAQFVGVQVANGGSNGSTTMTPNEWMEEYRSVLAFLQEIRSYISARDRHAANNDTTASQMAGMQGKKAMAMATTRAVALEETLKAEEKNVKSGPTNLFGLAPVLGLEKADGSQEGGLSKGELLRRQDLLVNLREERDVISKLLNTSPTKHVANGPDPSDRAVLFSFGKPDASPSLPAGTSSATRGPVGVSPARATRKFGVEQRPPPQETDITRPLDNQGLVQLQRQTMTDQEEQVDALSTVIRRQRQIGEQIGNELEVHNQLLDDLDQGVTRVASHLKSASKKLDSVSKSK